MTEVGFSREFIGNFKNEIIRFLDNDRVNDKIYCDVTMITENGEMKAHKTVLAACSEFFRTMFQSKMKEGSTGVIDLKHLQPNIVQMIMKYFYLSRIEITDENVFDVLHCADYMGLDELKGFCREILLDNINGSNCLSIRAYAKRYGLQSVLRKANNYIIDNLANIRKNKEYLQLDINDLFRLFKERSSETPEKVVYESTIDWVNYKVDERKEYLPQLIAVVALEQLSPSYLAENVTTEPLLQGNLDCQHRIIEILLSHHEQTATKVAAEKRHRYLEEDSATVRKLMNTPKRDGDRWRLVDAKWFRKWELYVTDRGFAPPGPLDNSALYQDDDCTNVKQNLKEGEDYVAMPAAAWDHMVQRHGCIASQWAITIPLTTTAIDFVANSYTTSIKLQFSRFNYGSTAKQTATFTLSQTIGNVKSQILKKLGIGDNPGQRQRIRREDQAQLDDNQTLAQSGLRDGAVLQYQ